MTKVQTVREEGEPLESTLRRLEAMPDHLAAVAATMTADEIRWQPRVGEFSLLEHACHMRDLEREGYVVRISRMLDENRPELADFDGTRIAQERDYLAEEWDEALGAFRATRTRNVETVSALSTDALARTGVLEGVGELAIHQVVVAMAEHDAAHRAEIETLCELVRAKRSAGSGEDASPE